jgi:hypothetical protein
MNTAARIRELHAQGKSRAEIAAAVDRPMNHVRSVLSRHNARMARGETALHPPIGRPKRVETGDEA